ncbi:uncharacterized protein LOC135074939 isoform X2 [Ostrinia nubilalis]|uniref:uncharacterized protein LOC135074939 isoform X2 n=1 Tax=Ostrinia nubilalis TaxID=29057 RepID=UPI0030822E75
MSFGNSTDWPAHQSTLSCPQFRKCTKRWGKQRIAVNLIEPPPCAYRQHMGKKESADTEKEKEHESRGGPVHLCPPQAPRRSESARSGGGKSFQQREAANLNDPRKADVRCLGVRKIIESAREIKQYEGGHHAPVLRSKQSIHHIRQSSCRAVTLTKTRLQSREHIVFFKVVPSHIAGAPNTLSTSPSERNCRTSAPSLLRA